ncbi:JAB domain-containing protein [Candidatus Gracilibacteria bacterium]|nr:JAB domain-containing protein [Candidatus Gracilibacteria bacterium]
MTKSFTIRDLPPSERPRERLQKFGAEALSAQELLALILGRGIAGESVMVTVQRLLSTFGNVKAISEASLEELSQVRGIGLAKAAQIKAAFELAKRSEVEVGEKIFIKTAEDAVKLVKPKLKDKKKEYFLILSLDSRNNLIKISEISIGSLNANLVHPREIFKEAIQALANSIILIHNHPSGDAIPSKDDIDITKQLIDAGEIMGITILDHIVIGNQDYKSMKDKELLQLKGYSYE